MTEPINLPPEIDLTTAYAQKDFSPITVHYEGEGFAQFEKLNGIARGKVSLDFYENGSSTITMQVLSIESSNSTTGIFFADFQLLLSGKEPPPPGENVSTGFAEITSNNCIRLNVKAPEGIFVATRHLHYSPTFNFRMTEGFSASLTFQFSQSYFLVDNAKDAKYWRVALTNFISHVLNPTHDVINHVARIPTDRVFSERLISFEYENGLGFIELLENYEKRKERLEAGQEQRLISALMVGEIGENTEEAFDIENWLPLKLLPVLGFATGTEVGTPWLEFLDEEGKLSVRVHTSYAPPIFSKGHTTIDELQHHGIGELLSKYQALSDPSLPNLRVLMKYVVRGGLYIINVEDSLDSYFRALDSLCKHYNLDKQKLSINLEPDQQIAVKQALREAGDKIKAEIIKADASGKTDKSRILQRIQARVTNFDNSDKDFGLAVVDLLNHFGFPDAAIMDAYYNVNPRPDNSKWAGVLSHYRAITIHEGYFNFDNKNYDFEDVYSVMKHLHDIILRLILKIIGYGSTYNPAVPNGIPVQLVDWVKVGITTSEQLGYN